MRIQGENESRRGRVWKSAAVDLTRPIEECEYKYDIGVYNAFMDLA